MVHSPLGVMDAIVMAQIWKGHTDNLFSISRAWNMHRPPMNTEQPTNQLGSVSKIYQKYFEIHFISEERDQ